MALPRGLLAVLCVCLSVAGVSAATLPPPAKGKAAVGAAPPAFPSRFTGTALGVDWFWYDADTMVYRQDSVAYGSDGSVQIFYCTPSGDLDWFMLYYPGQPSRPFNPAKSNECVRGTIRATAPRTCADIFNRNMIGADPFNPVIIPLGGVVTNGIPSNYTYAGSAPCPSNTPTGHKCATWNLTKAVPKCGPGYYYRSWYTVDMTAGWPAEFVWLPMWYTPSIGGCESADFSSLFTLKSTGPIDQSLIQGFTSRIPLSTCHVGPPPPFVKDLYRGMKK